MQDEARPRDVDVVPCQERCFAGTTGSAPICDRGQVASGSFSPGHPIQRRHGASGTL